MARASYSTTPLLRSLVHRPQGVILVIRSSIRKYWGAFGKSVKSALADIPMGLSMLTEMVDSDPLNIL